MSEAPRIDVARYAKIVVLTGAGVSRASGLRTYRGTDGLWTTGEADPDTMTPAGFARDPAAVWALLGPFRAEARAAEPNAAHHALAEAERRTPGELVLVTQNIDALHTRAGSERVVEVHGNVFRTRCSDSTCAHPPFDDPEPPSEATPRCPTCGGPLRPDVVFFGEPLDVDAEWTVKRALRDCDLFLAVGTSGVVSPASNYVRSARYEGARTVYINLEPMEPPNPAFDETYLGPAESILPSLLG